MLEPTETKEHKFMIFFTYDNGLQMPKLKRGQFTIYCTLHQTIHNKSILNHTDLIINTDNIVMK